MQEQHKADVHWQAFRYVAGEMSDDEAERFEERLAVDQAAREAVSEAAQLTQAVALTESHEPVTLRPALVAAGGQARLLRSVAWMGFGAAVCLAIVVSAGWLDFRADAPLVSTEESREAARADEDATELAMSWIETKDELAVQTSDAQDALIDLLDAVEDESIAEEIAGDESVEVETPSWLLLAVGEEQGESATKEN